MAFLAGVEPTAFRLGGERSILLSYRNIFYIKFTYIFTFCQTKSRFLKVGFEKTFYHTAKSVDIFEKSDTITTEYPWGYGSVGRAMRSQRIGQGFESPYLHQWEPRSHSWFLFICVKGVVGIIVKTKVAEKKISYDWLTKPRQNGKFVKRTK